MPSDIQKAETIDPIPPAQRPGALKAPTHNAKARFVGEGAIATAPIPSPREDVPLLGEAPGTSTPGTSVGGAAPDSPDEPEVASASQETAPAEKEVLNPASIERPLVSGRQKELARSAPERKLRKARRGETPRLRKRRAGGLMGKLWR